MSRLFLPEVQLDLEDLINVGDYDNFDEVVIFADQRDVYVLEDFDSEPSHLFERAAAIYGLGVHNGKLYDCGSDSCVFESLSGNAVAKRVNDVNALCSHKGRLYDAGDEGIIFDTFSGKAIGGRGARVWALCSHDGMLYDAGDYDGIYDSFNTSKVANREDVTFSLVSFRGSIFDGGQYKDVMKNFNRSYTKFEDNGILDLFDYSGNLYGFGRKEYYEGCIFQLPDKERVYEFKDSDCPTCMISVPRSVLGGFL